MQHSISNNKGVTLIELLIVMIVVAILSVALFDSMSASISDAEAAQEKDFKANIVRALNNWLIPAHCEAPLDLGNYFDCKISVVFNRLLENAGLTATDLINFTDTESDEILSGAGAFAISSMRNCDTNGDGKISRAEALICLQNEQLPVAIVEKAKTLGQTHFATDNRNMSLLMPDESLEYDLPELNVCTMERQTYGAEDSSSEKKSKQITKYKKQLRTAKKTIQKLRRRK